MKSTINTFSEAVGAIPLTTVKNPALLMFSGVSAEQTASDLNLNDAPHEPHAKNQ